MLTRLLTQPKPRIILPSLVAALFVLAISFGGSATAAPVSHSNARASGAKPTIVLEHGAWADASGFDGVITRLVDDGYPVIAPADPLRGLVSDTAYLKSVLATIQGPIVLVGHSYGGMVISDAATGNSQVKALVYIAAFAPEQGETALQLTAARPGSLLNAPPQTVFNFGQDPALPAGDVDLYVKPSLFRTAFAADLPTGRAAALAATQRPIAGGALQDASTVPAWKTIPAWYLETTADRVIPPAEQQFMATRANAHLTKIDSSHLGWTKHHRIVDSIIEAAATATK